MELEAFWQACLARPGTTTDLPFGPEVRVFRVLGKIFAFASPGEAPARVSLKCDPEWSFVLRETYAAVTPGYHLNKTWWNTIVLDGSVPDHELVALLERSYALVVAKLKKAEREQLAGGARAAGP